MEKQTFLSVKLFQQLPNKLLSTSEAPPQWADSPSPAQSCTDDLSYICKLTFSNKKNI